MADILVGQLIVDRLAIAPGLDQTLAPHQRQMLGYGALVEADRLSELAHRAFALHDQAQNAQAVGIGQRLQKSLALSAER